jgi:hypothetical protein
MCAPQSIAEIWFYTWDSLEQTTVRPSCLSVVSLKDKMNPNGHIHYCIPLESSRQALEIDGQINYIWRAVKKL